MPWMPLLSGDDAERTMAVVRDIAAALTGPEAEADPAFATASLGRGTAGAAAFYAMLAGAGDDTARDAAMSFADRTIEMVSDAPIRGELYSGVVGAGWMLDAVGRRLAEPDEDDSDVDQVVAAMLAITPWPGAFDLVNGLVGHGVYCLERLPGAAARRNLDLVVERLAEIAEQRPEGLAWRTTARMMPPARHASFPDGYFDVGLAHGVAGVVAFLGYATEAGAHGARELLEPAVEWLRAQRLPDTEASAYPSLVAEGHHHASAARLAWCYGDPGMAAAFLAAGRALGADELVEEARSLARACGTSRIGQGVGDAGLCHGSAGLGHVLNRVGQALADEQVLDHAREWFRVALEMRRDEPVAGYPALDNTGDAPAWLPSAGVLEGTAGVGLALLSSVTATDPWWDAILLLSTP